MVEVNENLTRQVADLARLELSDAEVKLYTQQIGQILNYAELLQNLDVSGVEPLTHPLGVGAPLREDRVEEFPRATDGSSKILARAPAVEDEGFQVPPILST